MLKSVTDIDAGVMVVITIEILGCVILKLETTV